MDFDSSDNSSAHYSSKIRGQTFKQFQLEKLIKDGKVIPASRLSETQANDCSALKTLRKRHHLKSIRKSAAI